MVNGRLYKLTMSLRLLLSYVPTSLYGVLLFNRGVSLVIATNDVMVPSVRAAPTALHVDSDAFKTVCAADAKGW